MFKAIASSLGKILVYLCVVWPFHAHADDAEWHPGGLWCTASYYNHVMGDGSHSQTGTLVGPTTSSLSGFGTVRFWPRYRPNCSCGICLTVHFRGNGRIYSNRVTLSGPNGNTVNLRVFVNSSSNVSVWSSGQQVGWDFENRYAGKDWTEWDGGTVTLSFGLEPDSNYSNLEIGNYSGSVSGYNQVKIMEGTNGDYEKASATRNFTLNLSLNVEQYCQFTESPGNVNMEWTTGQSVVEGDTSFSAGCSKGTAFSVSLDGGIQDDIMTIENIESGDTIDLQVAHEPMSGLVDCLSSGVLNVPTTGTWSMNNPFCRTRLIFSPVSAVAPPGNGEATRMFEGSGMIKLTW